MEKLTDEEILGMIALLNRTIDSATETGAFLPDEVCIAHPAGPSSDEAVVPIMPLLKKFLREGVDRGVVRIPNCFKGEL